ncbi:MAG TPA: methyl-accepting chemotaxis protein [Bacillota bacterium]|nr:methyl-accepting chemotaxis protein [Bacillota bacterium]
MLINVKNRIILILSAMVLLSSCIVYFIHQSLHISQYLGYSHIVHSNLVINIFLCIPILFFTITILLYRTKKDHLLIPLLNTLTMTFSSMAMITSGDGMVEYHFSIFMVVAILGYYENIQLILIMTGLFAIQHIVGYLFLSEYIFGNVHGEYSFSMVFIHAVFLIGTSGAIIWQIKQKKKLLNKLNEKEKNQQVLSGIIEKLSFTSEKLTDSSVELQNNYELNRSAIKEIVAHIQEVSSGSNIQKKQTIESSEIIKEITNGIQRIVEASLDVSEVSISTAQEADRGNAMIQKTVKQINSISETVNISSETVQLLNNRSREIGEIVGLITDIASQTNLLALNAAIEAARAGEHGKGFAVVAEEVRKLAEQSAGSASRITGLIQAIQVETNTSVESMNSVIEEVKVGLEIVQQTGEIFEKILTSIAGVSDQIKQISHSAEEVSAGSEQASTSIQEMTIFAEEVTINAENVANNSVQQLDSVEFLASLISTLNGITLELQELIQNTRELKV